MVAINTEHVATIFIMLSHTSTVTFAVACLTASQQVHALRETLLQASNMTVGWRYWNSLSPQFQTRRILNDKCVCICSHLVGHYAHCVFVSPQYLIVHGCIFIGIPNTVCCCLMPFHVFHAKSKRVLLPIPLHYAPLKMCVSLDVVFKHFSYIS